MLTVSLQLVVTCQRQTSDQYCYNVTREHWCYHGGATVNIKRNSLPVRNPDITYGLFRRQLCYYYYFRHFDFTLKSGTFGVTGRSCQDAGQHGTNLGHPGKSGTGGTLRQALSTASIPSRGPIIDSWYLLRYTSTFVEISWGVDSIFQSTFTIHIKFEHGTWTWTWSRPQPTRWCAVISFTSPQMHYSSMFRCKHFVENSVKNSVIYGAFDYSRISMNHSYWLEVYKTTILVSFLLVLFFIAT